LVDKREKKEMIVMVQHLRAERVSGCGWMWIKKGRRKKGKQSIDRRKEGEREREEKIKKIKSKRNYTTLSGQARENVLPASYQCNTFSPLH